MDEIEPGKFVVVGLTEYGAVTIGEKYAGYLGLFLVIRDNDINKEWIVSCIAGNELACGIHPNADNECTIIYAFDRYCEVKMVIDHDDQEGLTRAFALITGNTNE